MEQDQRLTPLPKSLDLRAQKSEYPSGYVGFYDDEVSEGRRSLQQYFGVVKKRLPIILALTTIATAAVAFYMYSLPSQYMATTEMVIEPRKPKVQAKDSININFGNDANYYNTQLELLQNADLMKKVVVRLGLYKQAVLFGTEDRGFLSGLRSVFSSGKAESAPDNSLTVVEGVPEGGDVQTIQLSAEEKLRVGAHASKLKLNVDQKERTNLVNVSVTTPNPELSAKVADAVANVFIEEDAARETEGARRAYADLTKSIEDLGKTITEQEGDLIAYMRESNLPLAERGQDLLASRLQGLSETWMRSLDSRRQLEARYSAASQAGSRGMGVNIPDLYENKIYQDTVRINTERRAKLQDDIRGLDKELEDLEARRQAANTKWTPEHPAMKELLATIEEKKAARERKQIETTRLIDSDEKKIQRDAVSGALTSLRSQVEAARKQESQAQAAYEQEAASGKSPGPGGDRAEAEEGRTRYQSRPAQHIYGASKGTGAGDCQRPSGEHQDRGKCGCSGRTRRTAANPQYSRRISCLVRGRYRSRVPAGLPRRFGEDVRRYRPSPRIADAGADPASFRFGETTAEARCCEWQRQRQHEHSRYECPLSTGLITLEERRSPMAEAYRHLRTSLLFSSAGKPPQTILVTSSQPSEGKTTTAINTAITLAQADADVVIVDCDLRRPRLHSYFDLENTQGLTNYLSGERNTENLIKQCRELPRLKVITSGPIPPNPAELLSSNEMKNLLQFLRGRYKHVIIDSPPAISFTDAAILSTLVDGVVLVAMAGKSSIHLMRRFKHRLGNIGARIYGVVLNGIKSGSMEYDYYGSGYYEYYAKSEADTSTPMMEDVEVHRTEK